MKSGGKRSPQSLPSLRQKITFLCKWNNPSPSSEILLLKGFFIYSRFVLGCWYCSGFSCLVILLIWARLLPLAVTVFYFYCSLGCEDMMQCCEGSKLLNLDFQELKDMNADGAIYLAVISQLSHTDEIDNNVNEMIFAKTKISKRTKILFWNFPLIFFSYYFFSSDEKMGVGWGGAQKGRKKLLSSCLASNTCRNTCQIRPWQFSQIMRRIKIQNWKYFPLIQYKW